MKTLYIAIVILSSINMLAAFYKGFIVDEPTSEGYKAACFGWLTAALCASVVVSTTP